MQLAPQSHSAAFARKTKSVCLAFAVAITLHSQPAFALAVPVVGWGYSIGNGIYSLIFRDQPSISKGFGWFFDPPTPGLILSGRLTVQFDPTWTIGGIGWFGEFGADPSLPAPPLGASIIDVAVLQANANPLMQSAAISVNQIAGTAVFDFNWGASGFAPSTDHLNFAGIYFSNLTALPLNPLTILGSPGDVAQNGTGAATYMACRAPQPGSTPFFCGQFAIPEPSSLATFGAGLVALTIAGLTYGRRRKPHKDALCT